MTEQDTTPTWLMSFFCFQNRYSQELALMYLWQVDYNRARHYTNMAHEFFLFSESLSQMLALMYLWQKDYDRARHYTNMAHEFFLFPESLQPRVSSDVFVARRL